jgi:hypothetical protein
MPVSNITVVTIYRNLQQTILTGELISSLIELNSKLSARVFYFNMTGTKKAP